MTDSLHDEIFVEPKGSLSLKVIAIIAALVVTVLVFAGYSYLRQRHAEDTARSAAASQPPLEPKKPSKAVVRIDDAMLRGGNTILGGTVTNTSTERLSDVSVELELKRRKDATIDRKIVALEPTSLEPQQEGRYSIELEAQEFSSARLVALRSGPGATAIGFTTAQGQKRPPEVVGSKTITIDKRAPGGKRDDFLNSPDNPARVP
jgi:hypothetical protein